MLRSASLEVDSFRRSRLFGVNTTSGRGSPSSPWLRSRWKYCAGVVQLARRMLSFAQSCRKRSMRALECSGPLPSWPWGRSMVSRECCPHLARADDTNWSTIISALLKKSPYCASQTTSVSGSAAL